MLHRPCLHRRSLTSSAAGSRSRSCSASWSSCTSSATTSRPAGAACMSRCSRSASARRIASWVDRHGTRWKIAWLPLGGYVKMHGQERPEDVSAEVRATWIARPHLPREVGAARAPSSSPPGRSRISCWPWCCSPGCSPASASRSPCRWWATCCRAARPPMPGCRRTTGSTAITGQPIAQVRGHPAHHRGPSRPDAVADHHARRRHQHRRRCIPERRSSGGQRDRLAGHPRRHRSSTSHIGLGAALSGGVHADLGRDGGDRSAASGR